MLLALLSARSGHVITRPVQVIPRSTVYSTSVTVNIHEVFVTITLVLQGGPPVIQVPVVLRCWSRH